jgi:hypothetical protein
MLASDFMSLVYRILPGQYLYYVIIGLAVIAAAGGVWAWLRKKGQG